MEMISEFSERTRRLAEDHAAAFPGTAGFVAAVDDARNVIEAKPPVFSFTFYLDPNPQTMGGDPNIIFPRLVTETEGWLGSIVHSTELPDCEFSGRSRYRDQRCAPVQVGQRSP